MPEQDLDMELDAGLEPVVNIKYRDLFLSVTILLVT